MDINKHNNTPSPMDAEIERDVMELRSFLESIGDKPSEPHPAYWQNFLPRVHQRIEAGSTKKSGFRSLIWAPAIGTALVIVVAMGTIFWPRGDGKSSDSTANRITIVSPNNGAATTAKPAHLYNERQESSSLVLSKGEVELLDAIMADDDNAMFNAMADSQ